MKTRTRTPISAKIEVNKDKIYRISDPVQLAEIFFPSKNAKQRRAAFLAILFEIKNSCNQRLGTTDHIAKKYSLSHSALTKARSKMTRIGLIRKREGYWIFSTAFLKAIECLGHKLKSNQAPAQNLDQMDRERLFVEIAKGTS
jgi:hypothetical protein